MNLCVFQGTFNPIHNAHLKMAEFVLANFKFDKILFIPAYKPPHKSYDKSMSQHRFNMVKLAIQQNNPKFEISDIEYKSEEKSYTYNTIKKLYQIYKPNNKISFIIGTDAFKEIESWYQTNELKKLVNFIIFSRNTDKLQDLKVKGYNFEIVSMPPVDISSTQIREHIKQNKNITSFVPEKVEEYIKNNGLYK